MGSHASAHTQTVPKACKTLHAKNNKFNSLEVQRYVSKITKAAGSQSHQMQSSVQLSFSFYIPLLHTLYHNYIYAQRIKQEYLPTLQKINNNTITGN